MKKRVLQVLGNRLVLAHTPPWAYKPHKLLVFRGYPVTALNPTPPQAEQRKKLASAAYGLFGTKGKAMYKGVLMPKIAMDVAAKIKGSTGGLSKEERARIRHEATRVKWGF